jgi:uncharacterized alpha-E superfamily protein
LYWLGRYAERTDSITRLLRVLLIGITDAARPWRYRDAEPILNLAAWLDLAPLVAFDGTLRGFQPLALVQAAILDPGHPSGVVANIGHLLRTARNVRDRLPTDCWRVLMAFDRPNPAAGSGRAAPVRLLLRLEELLTLGAALSGSITESMPRDAAWRFLEIGKRLERALHLVAILRGTASPPRAGTRPVDERRLLSSMLALTDWRAAIADQPGEGHDRASVLRSVLSNPDDPRSLAFQLTALADHLSNLPHPSDGPASGSGLMELAAGLIASARTMLPESIAESCLPGMAMRDAFARFDLLLPELSDVLTQSYFTHAIDQIA